MKFDYILGNPPYQEDTEGTSDKPLYHTFMDAAYEVSDKVMLITPARFLFNAGKTPKAWNEKMLADPHLKVEYYEPDGTKVFPNADIKGGVAITYRDANREFGPIGIFSSSEELNSILHKVTSLMDGSLETLIYSTDSYKFSDLMHKEHTDVASILSKGHEYTVSTNVFDKLAGKIFFQQMPIDDYDYVRFLGRYNGKRTYMWIRADYIQDHENLKCWKVFLPKSNGVGNLQDVFSSPLVAEPGVGHTQSFISIGAFDTEYEAKACLQYIKSKFARTMLSFLKVTQHNSRPVWHYVPLQDFTPASDIDWSASIPEIDAQLYRKYGLDGREIEFIETHVKEMN